MYRKIETVSIYFSIFQFKSAFHEPLLRFVDATVHVKYSWDQGEEIVAEH